MKTNIFRRFVKNSFSSSRTPSIGVAFQSKEVTVDNAAHELLGWGTAGQKHYCGVAPMYYRNAGVAIALFDVIRKETFDSVGFWVDQPRAKIDNHIAIAICGKQTDFEGRSVVCPNEASEFAD